MNIKYSIALYILNHLIILWSLFNRRFVYSKSILLLSFFSILVFIGSFFFHPNYAIFSIFLFYIIEYLSMRYYLANWVLPASLIILQDMLITLVRLITIYIPSFLLKTPIFENFYIFFLIACIQSMLLVGASYFLKKLNEKYVVIPLLKELKKSYPTQGIFLLIIFFLLLASHLYLYLQRYHIPFFTLVFIFLLISITFFSFVILIKKNYQKESFLRSLYQSIEEERSNYELAREYRHDFVSVLIGLNGYLLDNDLLGAKNYLDELIDSSSKYLKDYQNTQLVSIHNSALKVLLAEFIERCKANNIYFELRIDNELKFLPIPQIDFIRVLSNLLNNAFDASMNEEAPYIYMIVKKNEQFWLFQIENSFTTKIDLKKILKRGFSTKQNHLGLGISNLNKILKKYPVINYNFQIKAQKFIVTLSFSDQT